jgi:uncharacterized protein (TIGR03435 family)
MTTDDMELVRQYAAHQSERAFATLVSRYTNLVYSVALRQVNQPPQAEAITQAVFILLARKAGSLDERTILPGWLYRTTCYVSSSVLKQELRRQQREQEAYMQSTLHEFQTDAAWQQMSPLLQEAMLRLGQTDRDALVLRFFKGCSLNEVGTALGSSEQAAKRRVYRAVEKLRNFFAKRGIVLSVTILTAAISAHSVQAAPAALAKSVTVVAMTKGVAASSSTLTLIKGALKIMAWSKVKTAVVIGVGVLIAAGAATTTVKEIQNYRDDNYPWQVENPTPDMLKKVPPLVRIVPTKFPDEPGGREVAEGSMAEGSPELDQVKLFGIGVHIENILRTAYDPARHNHNMVIFSTEISPERYDYIVSLPSGDSDALQQKIKKTFGLVGRNETIVTNALLLQVKNPDAVGLKPGTSENEVSSRDIIGEISFIDDGCEKLASALEKHFGMPVLDMTGLTNQYYYDLKWDQPDWQHQNLNGLKQALLDQLGLELVPTNMPIEMLVVERAP